MRAALVTDEVAWDDRRAVVEPDPQPPAEPTRERPLRLAAAARRNWLRVGPPVLFAGAMLFFLLPFAAVSCQEERTTLKGIQLVTGDTPGGEEAFGAPDFAQFVADEAAPLAMLAFAFAGLAALLSLLRAPTGPGLALAFGGLALGALVLLGFKGELDVAGVSVDRRIGYWLALLALTLAVAWIGVVWLRGGGGETFTAADPLILLAAAFGAVLLLAALIVPIEVRPSAQDSLPGFSVIDYIRPSDRSLYFWAVLEPIAGAVGVLLAVALIGPGRRLLGAGLLLGFGFAVAISAITALAVIQAGEDLTRTVGAGGFIALGGALLVLVAGTATYARLRRERPLDLAAAGAPSRFLALAGAVVVLVAVFVPYDYGGRGGPHFAVIGGDLPQGLIWGAVEPLCVFVAIVLVVLLAWTRVPRLVLAGFLFAVALQVGLFYAALLYPAFDHSQLGSLGPGAFLGIFGAALVIAAAVDLYRPWLPEQLALRGPVTTTPPA